MRLYSFNFKNEELSLYHNSEEWILHDGEKIIACSFNAGDLLDIYGKDTGENIYRTIVTAIETGKGDIVDDELIPNEVLKIAVKFSD